MNESIKKFIINKIELLSEKFPKISFRYGFDSVATQHLIEVHPESEYQNNNYKEAECDVILDFIKEYPEEEILFISNNKYIELKEVIYPKNGNLQFYFDSLNTSILIGNSNFHIGNGLGDLFENINVSIGTPKQLTKKNYVVYTKEPVSIDNTSYALAA